MDHRMRLRMVINSLLALLACLGASAQAQALVDPMRPATLAPAGGAPAAGPALHSIYISTAQRYALIDDTKVSIGDRFRGARVVAITETEVTLRGDEGTMVVKLFPDVEKRILERSGRGVSGGGARTK